VIDGFAVTIGARWKVMSFKERLFAILHALFDLMWIAMLVAMLRGGLRGDLDVFVFWVPFLAVVIYFRFKQARERWGF
jgi:hypothetical protein